MPDKQNKPAGINQITQFLIFLSKSANCIHILNVQNDIYPQKSLTLPLSVYANQDYIQCVLNLNGFPHVPNIAECTPFSRLQSFIPKENH